MVNATTEFRLDEQEDSALESEADIESAEAWKQRAIQLQFELRKRGFTQVAFAKRVGVAHATLNNVLHGRATSRRVAQEVATLLGQSIHELFPGRYRSEPRQR